MCTATLDGHLGYALIQLAAFVHAQLPPSANAPVMRAERRYQFDDGIRRRFRPGGGYFKHIVARWETVLMPFSAALALPDVVLSREDLAYVHLMGAELTGATLNRADLTGATLIGATLRGATLPSTPKVHGKT